MHHAVVLVAGRPSPPFAVVLRSSFAMYTSLPSAPTSLARCYSPASLLLTLAPPGLAQAAFAAYRPCLLSASAMAPVAGIPSHAFLDLRIRPRDMLTFAASYTRTGTRPRFLILSAHRLQSPLSEFAPHGPARASRGMSTEYRGSSAGKNEPARFRCERSGRFLHSSRLLSSLGSCHLLATREFVRLKRWTPLRRSRTRLSLRSSS